MFTGRWHFASVLDAAESRYRGDRNAQGAGIVTLTLFSSGNEIWAIVNPDPVW